ncbi:hypothetical protein [Methylobacterium sp. Leaf466]|uniref:hypothetical protein n=1 Tax=Methylobacterium sp. Leaf466 TaxID=1736386 RepID=UPI0006F5CFCA|nr:hypothetical protein [Methylobacterium sp. Leaf466]KQT90457.1 hypothetical protein ASG59_01285 [Methylobacterium sp. Leaf466]
MKPVRSVLTVLLAVAVTGCVASDRRPAEAVEAAAPPAPPPAAAVSPGPVLRPDGSCSEAGPVVATAIEPGIGECDLVRLKGRPPTDVLVGAGRAGREVQVLYAEPGAKELYFFVNARLDRIVKS